MRTVDLKRPEGQAIVHRLVRDADNVLENSDPATISLRPKAPVNRIHVT
jgi:crotonobetainyl-CoA:carnitine CoA-transferase CaiB-like acyl-CoA transferase